MPSTVRPPSVAPTRRCLGAVALVVLLALGAPAWASPAPATASTPDHTVAWGWPVEGAWAADSVPEVLRAFDPPEEVWLAGHRGVDLAAEPFSFVRSAGPGLVAFAGRLAGRGVVSVEHPDGLRTTYEPVDATIAEGDPVDTGTILGVLEPLTAHCGRTCLHWGLRDGESYLDPLSLVELPPPVLLPYGPPVSRVVPTFAWRWLV